MPSLPAMTMIYFGITCLLAGTGTLLFPEQAVENLKLPPTAASAVNGNGLAATAMGVFYLLAAYQENRMFFIASLFTRGLTTWVMWHQGGPWLPAVMWEGSGAALTAGALLWDRRWRSRI